MRSLLALLLLVAVATADGDRRKRKPVRLNEEQRVAAVEIVGREAWGQMQAWQQDLVLRRYAKYVNAPQPKREWIERLGLRRFLLSHKRPESGELPPPLREEIERTPERLRPLAVKMAFLRLRQLRLDRGLRRVPREHRWPLFRRLFPEPFDQEIAKSAYGELRGYLVKGVAKEVRKAMREEQAEQSPEAQRRFLKDALGREEEQVTERVKRELRRLRGLDPERARRVLELNALADSIRFTTPRQRELIRYALRPEECPLLDPARLGPRPEDRAERRLWERDFRTLARMELLFEAGFPRELVLHLSGMGSPDDFLRAVRSLREHRPRSEQGPNR